MNKFILVLLLPLVSTGQILHDVEIKEVIKQGLHYNYNFEFDKARALYQKVNLKYPNSPAFATLMHMQLYTQYAPVKDYPKIRSQYEFYLKKSVELAEKAVEKNENEPEAIFFMLSALGSMAAWQADNDEMMKAVNTARKAYPYMRKGMKLIDKQADFLFTTGLYNYYIEQYPEDHPIVKPFMIFFSDGNKKLGISQLEKCGRTALFTGVEADYYAAYIYIKHENRYDKAQKHINELIADYPENLLFKTKKLECELGLGNYNFVQNALSDLLNSKGNLYPLAGHLFAGIINEKHDKNLKAAEANYLKVLKYPNDARYTQDYRAMAHLGLGRVYIAQKNKVEAKKHLNFALDLSEYTSTTAEAKKLMKLF